MNYNDSLDFLFNSVKSYHKLGSNALRPGLRNIIKLCNEIGNPQNSYKIVHVGGTNGKGSSSYGISNVCIYNKLKTGLLTSPHVHDFRERITVNGVYIEKDFMVDFIESNKGIIKKLDPSFFEITTAMAFKYFEYKAIDVAIIEVGMGGRFDSTNIVNSDVALITNIGLDHQKILGNTIEKIAYEKAGIIKKEADFIKGERQDEIDNIFFSNSVAKNYFKSWEHIKIFSKKKKRVNFSKYKVEFQSLDFEIKVSNPTNYFKKNLPGIILASYRILKKFNIVIDKKSFNGLNIENEKNKIISRWDIVSSDPLVIVDGCHNKPSIEIIIDEINQHKFSKVFFVIGGTKEKNWNEICKILPNNFFYVVTKPNNDRAYSLTKFKKHFESNNLKYVSFNSLDKSLEYCKLNYSRNNLIFIGGSLFMAS